MTIRFSVFISTFGGWVASPTSHGTNTSLATARSTVSVSVFYLELSSSLCCSRLDVFSLFFSLLLSVSLLLGCNLGGEMLFLSSALLSFYFSKILMVWRGATGWFRPSWAEKERKMMMTVVDAQRKGIFAMKMKMKRRKKVFSLLCVCARTFKYHQTHKRNVSQMAFRLPRHADALRGIPFMLEAIIEKKGKSKLRSSILYISERATTGRRRRDKQNKTKKKESKPSTTTLTRERGEPTSRKCMKTR